MFNPRGAEETCGEQGEAIARYELAFFSNNFIYYRELELVEVSYNPPTRSKAITRHAYIYAADCWHGVVLLAVFTSFRAATTARQRLKVDFERMVISNSAM